MADDRDVISWQLYCNEEMAFIGPIPRFRFQGQPTLCPNDHANRTNFQSPTVIAIQARNTVVSTEPTMGLYEVKLLSFSVPAGLPGSVTSFTTTFPTNVEIWTTAIDISDSMVGDSVTISVAPNTVVGLLTAAVSSGNIINVPLATVSNANLMVGAVVELYNSSTMDTQNVGQILAIDKDNYTMTVELPITLSFPIGTYVRVTNYMMRDYKLTRAGWREFSKKGLKAKQIPALFSVVYTVTNGDGMAKTHNVHIELYKF